MIGTRVNDTELRKVLGENMASLLGIEIPEEYREKQRDDEAIREDSDHRTNSETPNGGNL